MTMKLVAAGILPAVEPGFQPGEGTLRLPKSAEFCESLKSSSSVPNGETPSSTAGKMPAATDPQTNLPNAMPGNYAVPARRRLTHDSLTRIHDQRNFAHQGH